MGTIEESTEVRSKKNGTAVKTAITVFVTIALFRFTSLLVDLLYFNLDRGETELQFYLSEFKSLIKAVLCISVAVLIALWIASWAKNGKAWARYLILGIWIFLALLPLRVRQYHRNVSIDDLNRMALGEDFTDEYLNEILDTPIEIEFRLIDENGTDTKPLHKLKSTGEMVSLSSEVIISEDDFLVASLRELEPRFAINLTLNDKGAEQFLDVTKRNVGKRIGFIVDGELTWVGAIETPIYRNFFINAGYYEDEAIEIVERINR